MIDHYRFGLPIETDAVIIDVPISEGIPAGWKYDERGIVFKHALTDDSVVYGLGETVRGINKKGWMYCSCNTDEPLHLETRHSLYASHNFFIYDSAKERFGVFVDSPSKISFDIGCTNMQVLSICLESPDFDLYLLSSSSCLEIVREFRSLIGQSYIPPKWALGFGQSRWGYCCEDDVRSVLREYRKAQIPLDMIYLDIDYMDQYKDFTVSEERFPEFPEFVSEMQKERIHLVPIIDAAVKKEDGYTVYDEGKSEGLFCKKANGEDQTVAVWPGKSCLPDFLNEKARGWFGDKYRCLLEAGIDGFWNDMNEPAIFYTEDRLAEVFEKIEAYKDVNLDVQSFFAFRQLTEALSDNPSDYQSFYHKYHGKMIRHDKVHNLYGYYMARSASEAFRRLSPCKRILLFSRASYIGMHRYAGIWTGDNRSWWSHLLLEIQQMPGLNMCGFLYSGADIGGYRENCTEDLLLRWTAFGIFTPLFRNHSANGTRHQEFYSFSHIQWFANLVRIRYALIPYIYSELMKAILNNGMYFMPLSFLYPEDVRARNIEDQLLVGESIMIAPIYVQNARGRYVYLPEAMKMLRMKSPEDYDTEVLSAGDHYVSAALNEILIFIRPGHVLPVAKPAQTVQEIDYRSIAYLTFKASADSYFLYSDDGDTPLC